MSINSISAQKPSPGKILYRYLSLCTVVIAALMTTSQAVGAGFALMEQNASGAGNAFSNAAEASDASVIYYNPAGLTYLKESNFVASINVVLVSIDYVDQGSTVAGAFPITGNNGNDGGVSVIIPTIYFSTPITDRIVAGIGLHVPFGFATEYDDDWVGRYHGIKSDITAMHLNPSVGIKLTDKLSFGAGLNFKFIDAELSNAIDFGLAGFALSIPGFLPGSADGKVVVSGDDTSIGYNLGFMYQATEETRIGVHYRSKASHELSGEAVLTNVPAPFAPTFFTQSITADVTLPETVSAHFYSTLEGGWALMGNITWTRWSRFQALAIDFSNPGTPDSSVTYNWEDALAYSLGLNYLLSDSVTLKMGAGYDETPVSSALLRGPRIPDADRTRIALGFNWKVSEKVNFDLAYTHLFVGSAPINNTDDQTHNLLGTFSGSADIISAQLSWKF
ncbi:MAG: outer membrane protein transport protein [Opitutaceae bacterium]|nr:outer membrane protein transport protein [Opitutaceae bacterium]